MRLLTSKLYRAFPELDRFSDEQCERFIKATGRGWRLWVHILLVTLVAAAGVWGAVRLGAFMVAGGQAGREWIEGTVFAAGIAVGPALAIIARDLLLRLRVGWVLRHRAHCLKCGYCLIRLAPDAGNSVRCPECSTACETDPSLGELIVDREGRLIFEPSSPSARIPKLLTPHRVRVIKRIARGAALAAVVAGPVLWAVYELWLDRQTARAMGDRVSDERLAAMVEAAQPPVTGDAINAWILLEPVLSAMAASDLKVDATSPNALGPGGGQVWANFTYIVTPPLLEQTYQTFTAFQREEWAKSEALAREHLEGYRKDGVFTKFRELAAAPRSVASLRSRDKEPLAHVEARVSDYGYVYHLATINAARMRIARERGDLDEAVRSYEEMLAFSRMCRTQASTNSELTGIAIEAMGAAQVAAILAGHPSERLLDDLEGAMARQLTSLPKERAIVAAKLVWLDLVAYAFSNKEFTRFGRFSRRPSRSLMMPPIADSPLPLGTYEENRDAIELYFEAYERLASLAPWRRPLPHPDRPSRFRLLVENIDIAEPEGRLLQMDQNELERLGLSVMIALERLFARHHEYPEDLAAVKPDVLKQSPIDPWSGKPLCYRRVEAEKDPQRRGYVLYSVGGDRVDDGGVPAPKGLEWCSLHWRAGPGTDYIINDLHR